MSAISLKTNPPTVDVLLSEAKRAAEANAFNAALLIAWGAIEAAIEQATNQMGLSGSLSISYAYNRGLIDHYAYAFLLDTVKMRNAVAHGVLQTQADRHRFDELSRIVQRIVANSEFLTTGVKLQPMREIVGGESYDYFPLGAYVVRSPGVCGGRPTFKYTRIEVEGALQRLASGEPFAQVVAGYSGRVAAEALQEAIDIRARPLLDTVPEFAIA